MHHKQSLRQQAPQRALLSENVSALPLRPARRCRSRSICVRTFPRPHPTCRNRNQIIRPAACFQNTQQQGLRLLGRVTGTFRGGAPDHINIPNILHIDHRIPAPLIAKFRHPLKTIGFQTAIIGFFLRQLQIISGRFAVNQNGVMFSGKVPFAAATDLYCQIISLTKLRSPKISSKRILT